MKIKFIESKSLAEESMLLAGDKILTINGQELNDFIDWEYLKNDDYYEIEILRNQKRLNFEIENPNFSDLGISLAEPDYITCENSCVFCFVHQNAPKLRKTLYFMDDDYRLSFLYGNFITLTNVTYSELDRIIEKGMSPIYISVHATDIDVRSKLLRGRNSEDNILGKLKYIASNGIEINTQVVLCPELNDNFVLEKTYLDLKALFPVLKTLAIVPVGLTQFRKGLTKVKTVDKNYALKMIETVSLWQKNCVKELKDTFVFLSDEWFILAGKEVPKAKHYGDFSQIENGVGLVRKFIDDFEKEFLTLPKAILHKKTITFATNSLPQKYIRQVAKKLCEIENLHVKVEVLESIFWGKEVTCSGLLTGIDYYEGLKNKELGDLVVLPPECLSFEGFFLDDWTLPELETKLGVKLMKFEGSFKEVIFGHKNLLKVS
ncbi:DUF512 domain-containing protein [bacterium]|nr:DUF512 domain-containing protein [bacterium]